MKTIHILLPFTILLSLNSCGQQQGYPTSSSSSKVRATAKVSSAELSKYHTAVFAAGCFWCEEAVFESIQGVAEVISGYAGGTTKNPTYEQTNTGTTGHAESVEVYYDTTVIDYKTLLRVYFASGDLTQVNGQGPDIGSQYRSIIFYKNPVEKEMAESYIATLNASKKYKRPISVEVVPLTMFWVAEDYHQDYVQHNPGSSYVQYESIPRLKRAQAQLSDVLKPGLGQH
ncbi:peptide-methionine (S)-S-oxide reductase MsrA [Haliscomenobacter hydrossis]|uniref:Peptide methionine sulfoxide reductase MsrA n=1 Tax=Haliscomenobacter hydrossis (strain ATCC 27775 / DSM 1100 / LMG 10767 / O) TaxID=760192 RepID=F4L4T5_HALH1|nr:peptide-methionine (S)-S-oxide reductase MsrA [Haliscomenobacter hydrossis]AEE53033.1 Peptide methionine sulfoxide reductase msrA [Haliscomenobacter hydrossis DSM 1100]